MIIDAETRPAIVGGRPMRESRVRPRVVVNEVTRQRVLGLLDGGTLSDWYGGPWSHKFEEAFARWHGIRHAIATNSGTAALHVAIAAAGIGPGDEVLLPTSAYHSAAFAILMENAVPVPCDIEPVGLTIDVSDAERRITPRTRAIMPVHLYGYPSDMNAVQHLAERHHLIIIEDCGQSHGAQIGGRYVGVIGNFGCFSLASPRKHIAVGEGGMVITDNDAAAIECRRVVNKGKDNGWAAHRRMGHSYTMPEFEAIIGLQGLEDLHEEIQRRRAAARVYSEVLNSSGLEVDSEPTDRLHTYFRRVIRLPHEFAPWRDWFVDAVAAENISIKPPHVAIHRISVLANRLTYARGCPYTCQSVDRDGAPWPTTLPVADRELGRTVDVETGPWLSVDDAYVSARGILKVWRYLQSDYRHIPVDDS